MVRVQRERVVPSLPAETAEDRGVDLGSVLFGAGRAEEGGPAPARIPQAASHGLGPASRLGAGLAAQGWSPELIEGRLKAQYAGDPSMRISHECLCQWIYAKPQRALDLRQYLARGRKRRTRKKGRKAKGPRIPMRVPIADRPEAVGSRKGFGHFESDTVVGAAPSRRCMNTQVERRSRRLFARLVDDKSASATARAEYEIFKDIPPAARVDRTWDNGTEASLHVLVDEALGMLTYFADPYSSWQRGSNENRNGRIRRYLPKGTGFEDLAQEDLDAIVGEINDTPMKLLGYKTPNEVWDEEIARLQSKAASPNTSVALTN